MVFFMAAWPRDSQADVHFGDDNLEVGAVGGPCAR